MSKNILCILLGAACASAWWATFNFDPRLFPLGILTSFFAIVVIVIETIKYNNWE